MTSKTTTGRKPRTAASATKPPGKPQPAEPTMTPVRAGRRTARTKQLADLPTSTDAMVAAPSAPVIAVASTAAPAIATLTPSALQPADIQRPASKQAAILAALRQEGGASIGELVTLTGWMVHSVRGLLSAVVRRKLGLALTSSPDGERGRVYRVTPPLQAEPETPVGAAAATPGPDPVAPVPLRTKRPYVRRLTAPAPQPRRPAIACGKAGRR